MFCCNLGLSNNIILTGWSDRTSPYLTNAHFDIYVPSSSKDIWISIGYRVSVNETILLNRIYSLFVLPSFVIINLLQLYLTGSEYYTLGDLPELMHSYKITSSASQRGSNIVIDRYGKITCEHNLL